MADENENDERHPYDVAEELADQKGLEGEDREDFIEAKMKRAGFKRGPGAWVSIGDDGDDGDKDDDDEPMTRGDWRRMQRQRKGTSYTPPRRKKEEGDGGEGKSSKKKRDAWWD